jgi:hypothetical protein
MHFVIRTGGGLRGGLSLHCPSTGGRLWFRQPFLDVSIVNRRYELSAGSQEIIGEAIIRDTLEFAVRPWTGDNTVPLERFGNGGYFRFSAQERIELTEDQASRIGRLRFTLIENRTRAGRIRQTKSSVWHLVIDRRESAQRLLLITCAMIESLQVAGA